MASAFPDPNTTTRRRFTEVMLQQPFPTNASAEWIEAATKTQTLLKRLIEEPAMEPNLEQTYSTPAKNKNKVYFMWDFVGRTLGNIYGVPGNTESLRGQTKERWNDAVGRNVLARNLILDTTPGMLNQMIEASNPEQRGKHPAFSESVLDAARAL